MSLKQKMWQSVAEYFESTSIHGFSHLRASKTLLGRLLWILIIGSCFSLAALLICESIDEANDNPILTNIETISVQDIPFPAVTINTAKPNVWRHFAKILNVEFKTTLGRFDKISWNTPKEYSFKNNIKYLNNIKRIKQ